MKQSEKEREEFLSVCGKHDYDLLTEKEKMTQSDYERITHITVSLGFINYTQTLIARYLDFVSIISTVANEFMQLFVEFGQMKEMDPEDEQVQLQVRKLQDYITDHFYTCSDKILSGLRRMYAGGGELTENIDDVGGVGTAEFVSKAIDTFYISRK